MPKSNTIGNRIYVLREKKGITQAELAKVMHVKRETVNQWENGARDLKTDYTIKLANYFSVTCDYILRGIKSENVDISKRLGFSDKTIEVFEALKEDNLAPIHNIIFENKNFYYMIHDLVSYMKNTIYFNQISNMIKDEKFPKHPFKNQDERDKSVAMFILQEDVAKSDSLLCYEASRKLEKLLNDFDFKKPLNNIPFEYIPDYTTQIENNLEKQILRQKAEEYLRKLKATNKKEQP